MDKYYPHVYPIVIRMVDCLSNQESQNKMGSGESTLYSYIDLLLADDSSKIIQPIVKRQKREVRGQAYDLIDVFNFGGGSSEENLCLICMCDQPDCIIMPCRHMVVNIDCAKLIDEKKDKFECPLCRTEAEELIYVSAAMKAPEKQEEEPKNNTTAREESSAVRVDDIGVASSRL